MRTIAETSGNIALHLCFRMPLLPLVRPGFPSLDVVVAEDDDLIFRVFARAAPDHWVEIAAVERNHSRLANCRVNRAPVA